MDFFEIFTSGRYHSDMKILKILASNASIWEFMVFFKNSKLLCLEWHFRYYVFVDNFCSKQPLVSKFHQGMFLDSKNLKMTSKLSYCLLVLSYRKIQLKFIIQCISVKEKDVALFLDHTVSNIINLMWWKDELKFFI